jgi:hypothetical protein
MLLNKVILRNALLSAPILVTLLQCAEWKGVIYANQSGPSGKGTGAIRLATMNGIVSLRYQKPFPSKLTSPLCDDIGAVWTVTAVQLEAHESVLRSAHCRGQVESSVHSAWLVTRRFLQLLAADSDPLARRRKAAAIMRHEISNDSFDWAALDFSQYASYGGDGKCLEVKTAKHDLVEIETGASCFVKPALTFRVVRDRPTNEWKIDAVTAPNEPR